MRFLVVLFSCAAFVSAQAAAIPDTELLRYRISYAGAINVGEAQLAINRAPGGAELTFQATVPIPGFPVAEYGRSLVTTDLCTLELEKKAVRGRRQTDEKTTFDAAKRTATRQTTGPIPGGGTSTFNIPACPRDALAFLLQFRKTLAEGESTVYYGSAYKVSVRRIQQQGGDADRFSVRIRGPKSDITAELHLARDAARTPTLIRIPLAAGSLVVELTR
jgi:hypothetical protein